MAHAEEYDYVFKVIIIGEKRCGKTLLITRYAEGTFTDAYVPSIGLNLYNKCVTQDGMNIKAQIWDAAGQQRFRSLVRSYYRKCHGAMIVFDVTNRESFEQVSNWIENFEEYGPDESVPKLLVGSKCDLSEERYVTYEEAKSLAAKYDIDYVETSAKTNNNVDNAFETLYAEMRKKMGQQNIPSENVIRLDTECVAKEQLGMTVKEESTASISADERLDTECLAKEPLGMTVKEESTDSISADERLDTECVAKEPLGMTVKEESTASLSADEPPWVEEFMKELEKINSQIIPESLDKLENTVASMSKRLGELENKMSTLEKKS